MNGAWREAAIRHARNLVATAVGLIAASALAGGCASDGPRPASAEPPPKRTVVIRGDAYRPEVLRVPAGTRVTWVNTDPSADTVETHGVGFFEFDRTRLERQGKFDLHVLNRGEAESVVFRRPGRYDYSSSLDVHMRGTVIVTGGTSTVSQHVTRDFGHELLSGEDRAPLVGERTAMQVLDHRHDVRRFFNGGRLVEGIDGLTMRHDGASETLWVLNVNGIETDMEPIDYPLHRGDAVQWDLRPWHPLYDVRATVGAFPETFTQGSFGKRFPVTLRCQQRRSDACLRVERLLERAGVPVDGTLPPGKRPPEGEVQRALVLVGTWNRWREKPGPHRIDESVDDSGVFVRFTKAGDRIRLLDWNTKPVRTVGAGSGLVAAVRPSEADLLWLVTGVDRHGVARAARALTSPQLRDAFAAVVTKDGIQKVPLPPSR